MGKPRDTWLYRLKDGSEIVYYGVSNDPETREAGHRYNKRFTKMEVIAPALTRESADNRETAEIQRYQRQHGGRPPKYNINKTY